MNRLETEYSLHLEALKANGTILDWKYEAFKLKLADKTYYSPDFFVLLPDCSIELHDTKAAWKQKDGSYKPHVEAASSIKIKLAAQEFPFVFKHIWKLKGQGWQEHVF